MPRGESFVMPEEPVDIYPNTPHPRVIDGTRKEGLVVTKYGNYTGGERAPSSEYETDRRDGEYQRSNIGYIESKYDGDISSHYGKNRSENMEMGYSKGNEKGSLSEESGSDVKLGDLSKIIESLTPTLSNLFINKEGSKMSQELGTAAVAALLGKGQDGVGGLGSGVLGGALGALLIGALGGRGLGGVFGSGAADAVLGTRAALGELELQQATSALKDNISHVQSQISSEFAARDNSSALRGVDDKVSMVQREQAEQIGNLSKQIEEVKGFLTLQQKDSEINALRDKNQAYAEELNNQKLANLFKQSQDHVNIRVRESHDSINSTVRAILPLLVPAAAGGGSSISVDRVTEIVNALAAMADRQASSSSSISVTS